MKRTQIMASINSSLILIRIETAHIVTTLFADFKNLKEYCVKGNNHNTHIVYSLGNNA